MRLNELSKAGIGSQKVWAIVVNILCAIMLATLVFYVCEKDKQLKQQLVESNVAIQKDAIDDTLAAAFAPAIDMQRFYRVAQNVDSIGFRIMAPRNVTYLRDQQAVDLTRLGWIEQTSRENQSLARDTNGIVEEIQPKNVTPLFRYFALNMFPTDTGLIYFGGQIVTTGVDDNHNRPQLTRVFPVFGSELDVEMQPHGIQLSSLDYPYRGFVFATIDVDNILDTIMSRLKDRKEKIVITDFSVRFLTPKGSTSELEVLQSDEDRKGANEFVHNAEGLEFHLSFSQEFVGSSATIAQRHWRFFLSALFLVLIVLFLKSLLVRFGKRAEEKMTLARQDSEQKSQFLAMMSHEIRTPLNGIRGMAELVQREHLSDNQDKLVKTLIRSADSLTGLINDILDFSKLKAQKLEINPTEFDLSEMLDQIMTSANIAASEKQVELLLDVPWSVPRILILDDLRLRQILVNLLSNAIKFTETGHVKLSAEWSASCEETFITFVVEDTGIGITEAKLNAIFDPFRQADVSTTRQFGGSGLGLSIVKELTAMMGGKIDVESEPGKGSRFEVSIPVIAGCQKSKANLNLATTLNLKILAIGGSEFLRTQLRALEDIKANITHCMSGDDLGQGFDKAAGHADVLLIDESVGDLPNWLRDLKNMDVGDPPIIELRSSIKGFESRDVDANSGISTRVVGPVLPEILALRIAETFRMRLKKQDLTDSTTNIPSKAKANAEHRKNASIPISKPVAGPRVLLVEDDATNRLFVETLLVDLGCSVSIATNGKAAVEAVRGFRNFDLVFMDCQMPIMDGYSATKTIKLAVENGEIDDLPIVALTANALVGDRDLCISSGMNDFASKPVSKSVLSGLLKKWCKDVDRPVAQSAVASENMKADESYVPLENSTTLAEQSMKPTSAVLLQKSDLASTLSAPYSERNSNPVLQEPNINWSSFETTREKMGARFETLLELFKEDGQKYIREIHAAIDTSDLPTCSRLAHTLKSTSRMVGADMLSKLSFNIETNAKSKTPDLLQLKDLAKNIAERFELAVRDIDDQMSST